jgi:hypothetical protein
MPELLDVLGVFERRGAGGVVTTEKHLVVRIRIHHGLIAIWIGDHGLVTRFDELAVGDDEFVEIEARRVLLIVPQVELMGARHDDENLSF